VLTIALLTTAIVPSLMMDVKAVDSETEQVQEETEEKVEDEVTKEPGDGLSGEGTDVNIETPGGEDKGDTKKDDVGGTTDIIHEISFDVNGDITVVNVPNGQSIPTKLIPAIEVKGKELVGWLKDGEIFDITKSINGAESLNITLVAKLKDVEAGNLPVVPSGWLVVPTAGDLTVKVTFVDWDGSDLGETELLIGDSLESLPTSPSRAHFEFVGWFLDGNMVTTETVFSTDATVMAKYQGVEYKITYHLDGGVNSSANPSTYTVEDLPLHFTPPTKTDSQFIGWDFAATKIIGLPVGTSGDITLLAQWLTNTGGSASVNVDGYTITVHREKSTGQGHGEGLYFITVKDPEGKLIDVQKNLVGANGSEAPGYGFNYEAGGFGIKVSFELSGNKIVSKDTTIIITKAPVIFDPGTGGAWERTQPVIVPIGDPTPEAPINHKEANNPGLRFVGWMLNGTEFVTEPKDTVTGPATYVAQWTADKYTVIFAPGEQGVFGTQVTGNLQYGDPTPNAPTPEGNPGYTFIGWEPEVAETVTKDVVYIAQWKQDEHTIIYQPGAQGTWSQEGESHSANYGDKTPEFEGDLSGTKDEGWEFDGWSPELEDTVTKDVIYVAQWKLKAYTVTFLDEGITHHKETVKHGGDSTLPENPSKEGHTFKGWSLDGKNVVTDGHKNVTKDVELHAVYEINLHNITFKVEGNGTINGDTKDVIIPSVEHFTKWDEAWIPEAKGDDGYYLVGWFNSDGRPVENPFVEEIVKDEVFIAKFAQVGNIIITITGERLMGIPYDGNNHFVEYNEDWIFIPEAYKDIITVTATKDIIDQIDSTLTLTNVGKEEITLKVSDFEYTIKDLKPEKYQVTINIVQHPGVEVIPKEALVVVSYNPNSKMAITPDPEMDIQMSGFLAGDKPILGKDFYLSREPGETIGVYNIIFVDKDNKPTGVEPKNHNPNYNITWELHDLEIVKNTKPGEDDPHDPLDHFELIITGNSRVEDYNGHRYRVRGFTTNDLPEGLKVTATTSNPRGRNANGDGVANQVSNVVVTYNNCKVGEDELSITIIHGSLQINKRQVMLISETDSKEYDGTPLTNPKVTYTDPVFTREVRRVTAIGTVTEVNEGKAPNTIGDITFRRGFTEDNYTIIRLEGGLWITQAGDEIEIIPSVIYQEIDVNSWVVMYDGYGHSLKATSKGGIDLGFEYQVVDQSGNIIKDWSKEIPKQTQVGVMFVNIKATNENFKVEPVTGTLKVIPRPVTVTVNNASKLFGTADIYNGYQINVFNETEVKPDILESIKESLANLLVSRTNLEVEAVGVYGEVLVVGIPEGLNNFDITLMPGDFEITNVIIPPPPPPVPDPDDPVEPVDPIVPIIPIDDPELPPVAPVTPIDPPPPIIPVPDTVIYPDPAPPAPAEITDEEVPTSGLADEDVPLAHRRGGAHWALLNLILTILTAMGAAVLWTLYFVNKRQEDEEAKEEAQGVANTTATNEAVDPSVANETAGDTGDQQEQKVKRHGILRILSIVPAVTAIIAFILTEDMRLRMRLIDRWTILMVLIALVQVAIMILAKKKLKKQEQEVAKEDGEGEVVEEVVVIEQLEIPGA
jgi:flagellar basal body-associated protein FliL